MAWQYKQPTPWNKLTNVSHSMVSSSKMMGPVSLWMLVVTPSFSLQQNGALLRISCWLMCPHGRVSLQSHRL